MNIKLPAGVKKAIESLLDATADVYTVESSVDEHHITRQTFVKTISALPCRVSYKTNDQARPTDDRTVDALTMEITLFYTDTSVDIPAGSKIIVTWEDGRTETFWNASKPAIYWNHGEVELSRKKEQA